MLQASEGWLKEATPFSCALFAQRSEDDEPELRRGRDGTMFVMGLNRKGQSPKRKWNHSGAALRVLCDFLVFSLTQVEHGNSWCVASCVYLAHSPNDGRGGGRKSGYAGYAANHRSRGSGAGQGRRSRSRSFRR